MAQSIYKQSGTDFIPVHSLNEEVFNRMKALAARLSLIVNFNWVTMSWSDGLHSPIVQLWEKRPVWRSGVDDYGEDYACWVGKDQNNWGGWGILDTRIIRQDPVLASLPQETNFSDFILKKVIQNG